MPNLFAEIFPEWTQWVMWALLAFSFLFLIISAVSQTKATSKMLKDTEDRIVENIETEYIREILIKDAVNRGVDMTNREILFFSSRFDGFVGAKIMEKEKKNEVS